MLEAHLVVLAVAHQVQFVADAPQKVQRREEVLDLLFREQPEVLVVVLAPGTGLCGLHAPVGGVVVAQPSRPLLQVRLEEVEGLAEGHVSLLHGLNLLIDEALGLCEELATDRLVETVEEHATAREVTRRQDRRGHRDVAARQLDGVGDGARGAAQGHLRVPEPILHPLRHRSHVGGHLVRKEEEDVHVGVDAHLAPRVASHGHDTKRIGVLAAPVEPALFGELEEPAQQPIDHVRMRFVDLTARGAGLVDFAQVAACRLQVGARRRRDFAARLIGREFRETPQVIADLGLDHSSAPRATRCWASR